MVIHTGNMVDDLAMLEYTDEVSTGECTGVRQFISSVG